MSVVGAIASVFASACVGGVFGGQSRAEGSESARAIVAALDTRFRATGERPKIEACASGAEVLLSPVLRSHLLGPNGSVDSIRTTAICMPRTPLFAPGGDYRVLLFESFRLRGDIATLILISRRADTFQRETFELRRVGARGRWYVRSLTITGFGEALS